MVKDVKPVENGLVTRSNKLIEARYKLSLHEQKVIYSIISLIQPNEKSFNTFRFRISELAKFCGISPKNANRELEEVTRTLRSRVLTIKEGRRTIQTGWINSAVYDAGVIEFELDQKLKPYLLGLKDVFTSMKVSELMKFKSQYSGRVYELLFQQASFKERSFTVDEFKELLGLDVKEYSLFSNLKARIIEVAVKDINKNTPMKVTYETTKTGNKITSITFHMKIKPPKKEECLGFDMFPEETPAPDPAPDTNADLILQLAAIGIKQPKAGELIETYTALVVREKLDSSHAEKKRLQNTPYPMKSQAGWVISALKRGFDDRLAAQKAEQARKEEATKKAAEREAALLAELNARAEESAATLSPEFKALADRMKSYASKGREN